MGPRLASGHWEPSLSAGRLTVCRPQREGVEGWGLRRGWGLSPGMAGHLGGASPRPAVKQSRGAGTEEPSKNPALLYKGARAWPGPTGSRGIWGGAGRPPLPQPRGAGALGGEDSGAQPRTAFHPLP